LNNVFGEYNLQCSAEIIMIGIQSIIRPTFENQLCSYNVILLIKSLKLLSCFIVLIKKMIFKKLLQKLLALLIKQL